jgi:multicomponent Na+:H+ antiporter subunit E
VFGLAQRMLNDEYKKARLSKMAEPDTENTFKVKKRNSLYLFSILFIIWLALTLSFNWQEILAGLFISIILTKVLNESYLELGLPPVGIQRIGYFVVYLLVLFKEIFRANIDVAYRVVHPKMPINPGIVVIQTSLKHDIAKLVLANSITLTPGTFTLDIEGERLLIHWINVKAEDMEQATKLIGERFEKYLKHIF